MGTCFVPGFSWPASNKKKYNHVFPKSWIIPNRCLFTDCEWRLFVITRIRAIDEWNSDAVEWYAKCILVSLLRCAQVHRSSASQSGWEWWVWHICLHFDGYGDWFGRQTNENRKQTLQFEWICLAVTINKRFTYASYASLAPMQCSSCVCYPTICCRPHLNGVLLQSFAHPIPIYQFRTCF